MTCSLILLGRRSVLIPFFFFFYDCSAKIVAEKISSGTHSSTCTALPEPSPLPASHTVFFPVRTSLPTLLAEKVRTFKLMNPGTAGVAPLAVIQSEKKKRRGKKRASDARRRWPL
jgi:hypothetical protein